MTYDEAMKAVADRKVVTRPGWSIMRALRIRDYGCSPDFRPEFFSGDPTVFDWEFDNVHGESSGLGGPYWPTDEDIEATDWMEYQIPESMHNISED